MSKKTPAAPEMALGVRTVKYVDEARKRPIVAEVWYPTELMGGEIFDDVWIHPKEVRDSPVAGRDKYPLILMSHGHLGDRRERTWLADALARQGYIVAAVDHHGDTRTTYDVATCLRFWNRASDFSFLLDQIQQEEGLKERIDFNRVGFVGYSLGGMTGLGLAGGRATNIKEAIVKLKAQFKGSLPEAVPEIDFREGEENFREPRIRSMLLICPAVFVYSQETLKQIRIPVGLIASIGDEVLPHPEHSFQLIKHLVPLKVRVLRQEISHFAFLNRVSEKGKLLLNKVLPIDPPCCDKGSVHREVSAFALEYFKETL
jgi:predicted dienelactone hydrolase